MTHPVIHVVCAAIEREGRYLITQRNPQAVFPLLWEFPGGRVQPHEGDQEALTRELRYRLGIEAQVTHIISTTVESYTAFDVHLGLYHVELGAIEPRPLRVHDLRWARHNELSHYTFVPTDERAISTLLGGVVGQGP